MTKKQPKPEKAERGPTRREQLAGILQAPDGTSIEEMGHGFGVQPHTARAMLSIAKKEGLGLPSGAATTVAIGSRQQNGRVTRLDAT